MLRNVEKHENLPTHDLDVWRCLLLKDPSTSQALYTPKQEYTINTTSDTTNGTTRPQVTNGTTDGTTWPKEAFTSEKIATSNKKQTQEGYQSPFQAWPVSTVCYYYDIYMCVCVYTEF